MQVNRHTGLIEQGLFVASPHYNQRPDADDISLIVLHSISLPPGQFVGDDVIQFFLGQLDCSRSPYYQLLKAMKVSAHLFIRRDGSIVQLVPFHLRAWHAGVSRFGQRDNVNDFSIGIELEGTETAQFSDAQYDALNQVIPALKTAYTGLAHAPVVAHSDIAPRRKSDPGLGFDWSRLV